MLQHLRIVQIYHFIKRIITCYDVVANGKRKIFVKRLQLNAFCGIIKGKNRMDQKALQKLFLFHIISLKQISFMQIFDLMTKELEDKK